MHKAFHSFSQPPNDHRFYKHVEHDLFQLEQCLSNKIINVVMGRFNLT